MMCRVVLFLFFLIMFVRYAEMEAFTSVAKMKNLARLEVGMFESLRRFIRDSDTMELNVEDYIRKFEAKLATKIDNISSTQYAENPINAFHLLKRVNENWSRVMDNMICDTCELTDQVKEFQKNLRNMEQKAGILASVSTEEVELAAIAVVRLWQTYKLDLKALLKGQILNTTTEPLSCEDVLYICNSMESTEEYYEEIVWLQELLNDVKEGNILCSAKESSRLYRSLASAYAKYGMPWISLDILEKRLKDDPDNAKLARDAKYYTMKVKDLSDAEKDVKLEPRDEPWRPNYEALCRGEGKRGIKETSSLRCIYRRTRLPYYVAKEEILSYSPRISLFHEVISESEINVMKTAALEFLNPSAVAAEIDFKVNHQQRVSQTAWLPKENSDVVQRLALRIQLITSLSTLEYNLMTHAEYFQVVNYGIGGMYLLHYDFFGIRLWEDSYSQSSPVYYTGTGDRVATWMFYLSDVIAGGATVFPEVNITIPVEKGAAAFWYNLQPNGEYDDRTLHAGCPVLLGSKWVANKWFREHGQVFKRKCGKTYDSTEPLFPE